MTYYYKISLLYIDILFVIFRKHYIALLIAHCHVLYSVLLAYNKYMELFIFHLNNNSCLSHVFITKYGGHRTCLLFTYNVLYRFSDNDMTTRTFNWYKISRRTHVECKWRCCEACSQIKYVKCLWEQCLYLACLLLLYVCSLHSYGQKRKKTEFY